MATVILTRQEWSALDKQGWNKLIRQWNRKKGFMKQIPQASVSRTSYMTEAEEQETLKRRQKRPVTHASHVSWTEVPQKLPYVFGETELHLQEACRKNGQPYEARVKDPDVSKVYVDADFMAMVKTNA